MKVQMYLSRADFAWNGKQLENSSEISEGNCRLKALTQQQNVCDGQNTMR